MKKQSSNVSNPFVTKREGLQLLYQNRKVSFFTRLSLKNQWMVCHFHQAGFDRTVIFHLQPGKTVHKTASYFLHKNFSKMNLCIYLLLGSLSLCINHVVMKDRPEKLSQDYVRITDGYSNQCKNIYWHRPKRKRRNKPEKLTIKKHFVCRLI
jgi:hypothetical protein